MENQTSYTTIRVRSKIHVVVDRMRHNSYYYKRDEGVRDDLVILPQPDYRKTGKALAGVLTDYDLRQSDPIANWMARTNKV